jgi:hypothetical protein
VTAGFQSPNITTGNTRKDAIEQAQQAVKDYERRRKEGEFEDWYNSEGE